MKVLGETTKVTGDEVMGCFLNGIWKGNGSVVVTFRDHEGVLPHQGLAVMIITDLLSNAVCQTAGWTFLYEISLRLLPWLLTVC